MTERLHHLRNKLQVTNRRHDVIAVSVTDPREESLPDVGRICIEDAESGQVVELDTGKRQSPRGLSQNNPANAANSPPRASARLAWICSNSSTAKTGCPPSWAFSKTAANVPADPPAMPADRLMPNPKITRAIMPAVIAACLGFPRIYPPKRPTRTRTSAARRPWSRFPTRRKLITPRLARYGRSHSACYSSSGSCGKDSPPPAAPQKPAGNRPRVARGTRGRPQLMAAEAFAEPRRPDRQAIPRRPLRAGRAAPHDRGIFARSRRHGKVPPLQRPERSLAGVSEILRPGEIRRLATGCHQRSDLFRAATRDSSQATAAGQAPWHHRARAGQSRRAHDRKASSGSASRQDFR